jgi:serine/threonine protein kinase
VSRLGAGGEVYRAASSTARARCRDQSVAGLLQRGPERLHRFEQEARAAAALNHPNIVTVHSVGEAGEIRFLMMELMEAHG